MFQGSAVWPGARRGYHRNMISKLFPHTAAIWVRGMAGGNDDLSTPVRCAGFLGLGVPLPKLSKLPILRVPFWADRARRFMSATRRRLAIVKVDRITGTLGTWPR